MKLISDCGRWATIDNTMIFTNVVWISNEKDALHYHLVDDNGNNIELEKPLTDYIVSA